MGKPKPIELMHLYYGTNTEKTCGECCNLVEYRAGNKTVRKCRAYGLTCSCRSDFAKRWTACNLFGKEIDCYILSDNDDIVIADKYGDELTEAPLSDVIKFLENEVQSGETYRRIKPLLGLLKSFDESQWGNLVCLHYGY